MGQDDITNIYRLIDWNSPIEDQKKGILYAQEIKDISCFIQPMDCQYNKSIWENCAMIISHRTNEELEPYIIPLLEWLQDMNWPGANIICERLKKISIDFIFKPMSYVIMRASEKDDKEWLYNLRELVNNDIYQMLSVEKKRIINSIDSFM